MGVLALSLVTVSPGKWRGRYHLLDGPICTTSCMAAIEQAIKTSPLDYFWLQERWKVFVRPDRTICDWLGPDTLGEGTPHRALLWRPGTPDSWLIPVEWTHPDVNYETLPLTATPPTNRDGLVKFLAKIDAAHPLPIDYILTCHASKALIKAARRLAIPLISLS